jgi:hypothetical protein
MDEFAKRPKEMLGECGITSGRVGMFGHTDLGMALHIIERIKAELPELEILGENLEDSLFMYAMESKDEAEVNRIRKMGKVTAAVVGKVRDFLTSCDVRDDEVPQMRKAHRLRLVMFIRRFACGFRSWRRPAFWFYLCHRT